MSGLRSEQRRLKLRQNLIFPAFYFKHCPSAVFKAKVIYQMWGVRHKEHLENIGPWKGM